MNFRLTNRLMAALTVALICLSATLQPAASAAPGLQDEESMGEGQEYTIQAGDSLYKISGEFLGNGALWPQIQEATNAMAAEDDSFATIDQPSLIRVGQKIWIPTASSGEMMDGAEDMDADMDHGDDDDEMDGADADDDNADDDADHDMSSDGDMDDDDADSAAATQALTGAAEQLAIAVSHASLLGDSLAADDLAMAQVHAEHVINILDGEDGRNFGDLNRDGKTQNPGDGVGVRGYLALAEAVDGGEEKSDSSPTTTEAVDTARKILAVDTAAEATVIADELNATLDDLASTISDGQSADEEMTDDSSGEEMSHGADDSDDGSATHFDEADGLFAMAATQVQLAIAHSGFLSDELDSDALAVAKNHAEHVINILDGEDGLFYGDNNRDGQIQNPGDGTGVRSYLEQALAQAESTAPDADLVTAIEQGLALVGDASNGALELIAADSSEGAAQVAAMLTTSLADLQVGIDEMLKMAPSTEDDAGTTAGDDDSESMDDEKSDEAADDDDSDDMAATETAETETAATEMTVDVASAVASLVSDGDGVLLNAQAQAEIAIKHFVFLEDSLVGDDLAMALAHAEHVINILDGEEGLLFGDNNRDGKTQNPGDGTGVRSYLADAGAQIETVLDGADAGDVQALLDAIQQGETAASDSAAGAVQLFASSSAADAQTVAAELGDLLAGLRESISAAVAAAVP